jgi:WD40 repeat protein
LDAPGKPASAVAAYNKEGTLLALGWPDGNVSIHKLSGDPPLVIAAHQGAVQRVMFSPIAGGPLASAGADGVVKLWRLDGGELHRFARTAPGACAFSPDGNRLATGGTDGVVRLWNPGSGEEIAALAANVGGIAALAFHPHGNPLATVHQKSPQSESVIKLWQLPEGRELPALRGHPGRVSTVTFTPDGRRLVTGSAQGRIKLWDFLCGHEVYEINLFVLLQQQAEVRDLGFSANGLTLAAATGDQLLLWKALPWRTR